jgi:antirestriction protein
MMLETYCENRTQEASSINRVKSEEQKREPMSEATIKMIAEFKAKQSEKRKAQFQVQELKELSEEQKLVNEWIAEFKSKVGYLQGFLEVDGKMLSIEQYLRLKQREYESL